LGWLQFCPAYCSDDGRQDILRDGVATHELNLFHRAKARHMQAQYGTTCDIELYFLKNG
jgi:hypothetical protein